MMANNMTDESFVAAIEIGSSKITGMIGRRMPDSSIQVLASTQENSSAFIRRGVVYNFDETSECLKTIKMHLQNSVNRTISKVYVCIGGQSLHSVLNNVVREFDVETKITQEMVDALYEEDRAQDMPDYTLTQVIPLDYYVGRQHQPSQSTLAGVMTDKFEGSFLNIFYRSRFYNMIKDCFTRAGFKKVEFMMTPIVLGEGVLSVDAKRTGCVLVDFGKDTTTVAIYSSRLLRRLAVIPLGSGNITNDIASVLRVEENEAEALKCKYSSAFSDAPEGEENDEQMYSLNDGRKVSARDLNEIVEARVEEIIMNVEEQIKRSGLKSNDDLISGAILTGGGSNLRDIDKAFKQYTDFSSDKIKFAKFVNFRVNSKTQSDKVANGTLNAILSLLAQGKDDCAGAPIDGGLFTEDGADTAASDTENNAAESKSDTEPADKKEESGENGAEKEKKAGFISKLGRKVKDIATKLVSPEE